MSDLTSLRRQRHAVCTLSGCRTPITTSGASLCAHHLAARNDHGHVRAKPLRTRELREFEMFVTRGLYRWQHTKVLRAALEVAEGLLHYRPDIGFGWQCYLESRMAGVARRHTARDVLQRVLEFYANLHHYPARFPNGDSERMALCRAVANLGKASKRHKLRRHYLITSGQYIADLVGAFAITFIRKLEAEEQAQRAALCDFSEAPPADTSPP